MSVPMDAKHRHRDRFQPIEDGTEFMKLLGKIANRIIDGLTNLTGWIAALCLVCAAIVVTEAVIVRKILGISTICK
jgi:hypothetical protein